MQRFGMVTRVIAVALGVVVALAALSFASAQSPQEPPHRFYGTDATPGDEIGVHLNDDALTLLGSATVDASGSWYVDVDRDAANGMVYSINGEVAEGDVTPTGAGQTQVSNLQVVPPPPPAPEPVCPEDGMMSEDDDSMMSEDDDSMMSEDSGDAMLDCPEEGDEDGMMDDGTGDDAMLDEDTGYPSTGSGGLADGGLSAGLIGLLIALGVATVAGLGYRRVRNRA